MLEKEEALLLHRKMWEDMRRDLGECPEAEDRIAYKGYWLKKNYGMGITHNCFLCEYVRNHNVSCKECPIIWPNECERKTKAFCCGMVGADGLYDESKSYLALPISEILALPVRSEKE